MANVLVHEYDTDYDVLRAYFASESKSTARQFFVAGSCRGLGLLAYS